MQALFWLTQGSVFDWYCIAGASMARALSRDANKWLSEETTADCHREVRSLPAAYCSNLSTTHPKRSKSPLCCKRNNQKSEEGNAVGNSATSTANNVHFDTGRKGAERTDGNATYLATQLLHFYLLLPQLCSTSQPILGGH